MAQTRRRTGQGPRVLLVEDDEMIRALAREVLERTGFEVDEAADGTTGIRMLEDLNRSYAVILSDLGLLGVRGEQVVARAAKLRPGVPIVVCTGEPIEDQMPAGLTLLRKPFLPKDLAALMRRLAGGSAPEESQVIG